MSTKLKNPAAESANGHPGDREQVVVRRRQKETEGPTLPESAEWAYDDRIQEVFYRHGDERVRIGDLKREYIWATMMLQLTDELRRFDTLLLALALQKFDRLRDKWETFGG